MDNKEKFVCPVHGGRDQLQPQRAIFEAGNLDSVVVEITPRLTNFLKRYNDTHLSIPRSVVIPPEFMHTSVKSLLHELAAKVNIQLGLSVKNYAWLESAKHIGLLAKRLSERGNHSLFSELYSAHWSFSGNKTAGRKILFQTHPHIDMLQTLYRERLAIKQEGTGLSDLSLTTEPDMGASAEQRYGLREAAFAADKIICASEFTKNSLLYAGIDADRVFVAPYGVDTEVFYPEPDVQKSEILNLIYVGQSVQRKGVDLLIASWLRLNLPNAKLTIVGGGFPTQKLKNLHSSIDFVGRVPDGELRSLLTKATALILPSIAEGFGLVILQSLACGTPVLATNNTALPDIMKNFKVGKVIEKFSDNSLCDYINWSYHNVETLNKMKDQSLTAANYYSWSRFRKSILFGLQ